MANIQNLKPLPKGHKLSPGRPRGVSVTTVFKRMLETSLSMKNKSIKGNFEAAKDLGFELDEKNFTGQELLALKMMQKALNGDLKSAREILDRVEGKPIQRVETADISHEDWLERFKEDGQE